MPRQTCSPFHRDTYVLTANSCSDLQFCCRKRLDRRIKRKQEQLRRRYREIHGKKVDWISHWIEEGILFFTVKFMDGKCFSVTSSPCVILDTIDFSDMSTGDDVILKEYYRRKDL